MLFDQSFGDGETEAGSFVRRLRLDLVEFVKNRLVLRGGDADSCVADGNGDEIAVAFGFDPDQAAFGGEFDGLAQQVEHDLPEAQVIGIEQIVGVEPGFDAYRLRGGLGPMEANASATAPHRSINWRWSSIRPASILLRSRIWLMSWSRWPESRRMWETKIS